MAALSLLVAACGGRDAPPAPPTEPVAVFATLPRETIMPVLDAYTARTGVAIRYVDEGEQPRARPLSLNDESMTADLVLAADATDLAQAAEQGVLRPTYSNALAANIPALLRDPDSMWFALSVRPQAIVYDARAVDSDDLAGYDGLADDRWRGSLCLSTSATANSRLLVAALIRQSDERTAERIVRGWVRNLGAPVFPDDSGVLQAMEDGHCRVGIVSAREFGRRRQDRPDSALAVAWPRADTGGAHVSVSGGGVLRHAHNAEGAAALLEWLSSPEAQVLLVAGDFDYPANPAVPAQPLTELWGRYPASALNVAEVAGYAADAIRLVERAGYR